MASRVLRWIGGDAKRIRSLPLGAGWSDYRDLPVPSGSTFKDRWAQRQR
jgi:L-lactate dehydrogenase complex protein LldF